MKQYEFNAMENDVIDDLAWKMTAVGWFLFVAGAGAAALAVAHASASESGYTFSLAILTAFFVTTGALTLRTAKSFGRIVRSEGSDITHVLSAFDSLRLHYTLKFWLVIGFLVLALLGFLTPQALGS